MPGNQEPGDKHGPSVTYNGKQTFLPKEDMTGAELYAAFSVPSGHRLFLEAPGSQPDQRILQDGQLHHIKNGSHFYDLPEGQFGAMLPRVEAEIEALKHEYGAQNVRVAQQPDGTLLVQIESVSIHAGWNKSTVTLRFMVPQAYPQARPDGFFVDRDLVLAATNAAGKGSGDAALPDGTWRRFCWQPKSWDMSRESLLRYAKFVETRFHEVE